MGRQAGQNQDMQSGHTLKQPSHWNIYYQSPSFEMFQLIANLIKSIANILSRPAHAPSSYCYPNKHYAK
jgi:hypothetical protein